MPMAIGAQMEYPERQVIALCGDGGLSMLLGDLITIVQYRLPVKIVVYNNDWSGFHPIGNAAAGLIPWQINLNNPSFAAVADAVGIKGFLLDKSSQVDQMVDMFLNYPGAALLDAHVDRDALALPPYIRYGPGGGLFPCHDEADAGRGSEAGMEHPGRKQEAVQTVMPCGQGAGTGKGSGSLFMVTPWKGLFSALPSRFSGWLCLWRPS